MNRNKLPEKVVHSLVSELNEAMRVVGLDSPLSSDMGIADIHRAVIARTFTKKFVYAEQPQAEAKAFAKFREFNERCGQVTVQPGAIFDDELVNGVTDLLDDWLHPFGCPLTLEDILTDARPGKKASLGCDELDFYTKLFDSPLTATNDTLRVLYRTFISRNPTWAAAEKARDLHHGSRNVRGSKTSSVPKQNDIRRTICTEPTLNMFFQLGIGMEIRRILMSRLGLDLADQQDVNAELARLGSIDGSFGTIDLASASDSISIELCKRVLPKYFLRWLMLTRSPETIMPDGSWVELQMISSMGNGFTFPLQTMIFAAIVIVAYRLHGVPYAFRKSRSKTGRVNIGVFGDDIVVERSIYEYLIQKLPLFGFVVNADKSFNTGNFRESCGKDYWAGVLVRGVYLKELAYVTDCYSAINRLVRWGWRTSVDVKPLVTPLLRRCRFLPIPPRDGDDQGIHVPEALSPAFYDIDTHSALYRALEPISEGWRPHPDGLRRIGKKVCRPLNWDGILVAFVAGYLRDGRFSVRSENKRSKVRQKLVPFWDYAPKAVGVNPQGVGWHAYAAGIFVENASES